MAKAPKPPVKPTLPPVTETTEVNQDRPNIVNVKHKVSGREFYVSRKYYETYSQVLDLV